jgi:transcriptional regulator with XRE-family HTH domain
MKSSELKIIRDLSGLPLARFAKKLGVGQTTIQRYERGESPIPLEFTRRVWKEFNITPEVIEDIKNISRDIEKVKGVIYSE